MTDALKLVYAGVPYEDRMGALFRNELPSGCLDVTCVAFHDVGDLFRRMTAFAEFPIAEMSFATTVRLAGSGDDRFVALPIFPSRAFRHSQVYVRRDRGIRAAEDLKGKRVGLHEYEMTAAVWIRGFLADDFGVHAASIDWYTGGWEQPSAERRSTFNPGVRLTQVSDRALVEMLENGDLDAIVGAKAPSVFYRRPELVSRLFEDYRAVEADYFHRTRIFPMMHHIVIRREVYERHRWTAKALMEMFAESKAIGRRRLLDHDKPFVMHPWITDEVLRLESSFAGDPFAYGVQANRAALDTALRYCCEQGLTPTRLSVDDIYAPEVLDWLE